MTIFLWDLFLKGLTRIQFLMRCKHHLLIRPLNLKIFRFVLCFMLLLTSKDQFLLYNSYNWCWKYILVNNLSIPKQSFEQFQICQLEGGVTIEGNTGIHNLCNVLVLVVRWECLIKDKSLGLSFLSSFHPFSGLFYSSFFVWCWPSKLQVIF